MKRACPCGTGDDYVACCGRFHDRSELPVTPEQLMRSRYSAFVIGLDDYLHDTWHPGTAPDGPFTDPETTWLGLEILDAPEPGQRRGVVEFVARYREAGQKHELHERSRFVFQSGRWWYLDGVHG